MHAILVHLSWLVRTGREQNIIGRLASFVSEHAHPCFEKFLMLQQIWEEEAGPRRTRMYSSLDELLQNLGRGETPAKSEVRASASKAKEDVWRLPRLVASRGSSIGALGTVVRARACVCGMVNYPLLSLPQFEFSTGP